MNRPPQIKLESTIVKTVIEDGVLIFRHFFTWSERKTNDRLDLKVKLYAKDGRLITESKALKIPKQKKGSELSKFISIDAAVEAYGFSYSTAALLGRPSDDTIVLITEKREDLTAY